jgi:hydrogenase expression/formation protein HypE
MLLEKHATVDPQVIVGPQIGEDAAVIDLGEGTENYWVVAADPITFTTEEIGYYGVVVNLNDIATRGAIPRWFLATLLFPENGTFEEVENVFRQIGEACRRFHISLVGGHTEMTPGIDRVILSGQMIGEVKKNKLVRTSGAKVGDLLLLAKGICIEGTSILAREKGAELLERAKKFVFDPGIEILEAARLACDSASVHSMHDPTEGGLVNGIVEMALASDLEIQVDLRRVFVYDESRILCQHFGLDPLGVIASGALLLTISPADLSAVEAAFSKAAIPLKAIGEVKQGPGRVLLKEEKGVRQLEPFPRDEILKIYERNDGKME